MTKQPNMIKSKRRITRNTHICINNSFAFRNAIKSSKPEAIICTENTHMVKKKCPDLTL